MAECAARALATREYFTPLRQQQRVVGAGGELRTRRQLAGEERRGGARRQRAAALRCGSQLATRGRSPAENLACGKGRR